MRIESIKIKNFKSFRDADMSNIPQFCVIVGVPLRSFFVHKYPSMDIYASGTCGGATGSCILFQNGDTSCIALSVMADDEARVLRPAVRRMGVALVVKCAVFY